MRILTFESNRSGHLYPFQVPPDFAWESSTQGLILGSFFYGYIVTQIPGGWLATKYGGKRVFLVGISATAILTVLTPVLTKAGTGYLITTRILEGLFEVCHIYQLAHGTAKSLFLA